ncbi:MAG: hypothetical protein ABI729_08060, partial [Chitinophagales bacterium]
MKEWKEAFAQLKYIDAYAAGNAVIEKTEWKLKTLRAYRAYYNSIGNYKEELMYAERVSLLEDSLAAANKKGLDAIFRANTDSEISRAEKEIQLRKFQADQAEKTARNNLLIALMVALISIAIVFLLLIYFRGRNRLLSYEHALAQKELENKKLEQEKLAQELAYKKGDLHDLGVYLSQIKELHENIAARLR